MNKKFGFTLAELLIVLGITGVIAALLIGATKTLMPDKTKVMYLKAYDALARDIKDLGANSTLYPAVYEFNGSRLDTSKIPFVNNSQPIKPPFSSDARYSGDNKLCNVLAYTMHAEGNANCAATAYPATPSYTTRNGMRWWIVPQRYNIDVDNHTASYQTDIYVDVNSAKDSPNCMYGDNDCRNRNPDIFKFLLAADGTLVPADPQGQNYIKTRRVFTKHGAVEAGKNILSNLPDNLIDSEITPVREQCENGFVWDGSACVAEIPTCASGTVWNGSACVAEVPNCAAGTVWNGSACVAEIPTCSPGYSWNGSACVSSTPTPTKKKDVNVYLYVQKDDSPACQMRYYNGACMYFVAIPDVQDYEIFQTMKPVVSFRITDEAYYNNVREREMNKNKFYYSVTNRISDGSLLSSYKSMQEDIKPSEVVDLMTFYMECQENCSTNKINESNSYKFNAEFAPLIRTRFTSLSIMENEFRF